VIWPARGKNLEDIDPLSEGKEESHKKRTKGASLGTGMDRKGYGNEHMRWKKKSPGGGGGAFDSVVPSGSETSGTSRPAAHEDRGANITMCNGGGKASRGKGTRAASNKEGNSRSRVRVCETPNRELKKVAELWAPIIV